MATRGPAILLGPLELEIMRIIWQHGRCTGRSVYEQLLIDRDIAYTTVLTVIGRMSNKGLLVREEGKQGLKHVYVPLLSKEDFITHTIEGMFSDFRINAEERQRVVEALNQPSHQTSASQRRSAPSIV